MKPALAGMIVFACTFGGALLGMWLRTALPGHHLDDESRETVKLGIGLVATMTALVLGLITASAKSSFDAVDAAVRGTAVELLTLDRLLARYGSETGDVRLGLRNSVARRAETIWPESSSQRVDLSPSLDASGGEALTEAIRGLAPRDDAQRSLQSRALDVAESLLKERWLASAGTGPSVPLLFLAVLLFWLTITFAGFGLFAPGNGTVIAVLVVCALSVGGAVFLILEMDGPFHGLIKVSGDPWRYALTHLAR